MQYKAIHPTLRAALGTHEVFRRLHFTPEEIFVARNPDGEVLVLVQRYGQQFAVTVGTVPFDQATFETTWTKLVEDVRNRKVPDWTLQRCYNQSPPKQDMLGFLEALRTKGLLPGVAVS